MLTGQIGLDNGLDNLDDRLRRRTSNRAFLMVMIECRRVSGCLDDLDDLDDDLDIRSRGRTSNRACISGPSFALSRMRHAFLDIHLRIVP